MPEAARLLDPVAHTSALTGLLAGAVLGAVVGAAVIATGGAALAAVAVAAAGGASLGGAAGQLLGSLMSFPTGAIAAPCAPTVLIGGKPAARAMGDFVDCGGIPFTPAPPHPHVPIAQGSETVLILGLPAARVGDLVSCSAKIDKGCPTVVIGGPQGTFAKISPEVPWYAEAALLALGLVSGVGAIALAGQGMRVLTACRLAGGLAGGWGAGVAGHWAGGEIWGEGSAGQKLLGFGAGLVGGGLGARLAGSGPVYGPIQRWAARRSFPGQQHGNNCAPQSCQQILRNARGRNLSEAEMEQLAQGTGHYDPAHGSTPGVGPAEFLKAGGVPAHTEPGTPANIQAALGQGRGVVSSHNAGKLWGTSDTGGHAVQTTGVVRDPNGNVTHYVINDTGTGQAGALAPRAQYEDSLRGTPIAVTDNPIW